MRMLIFKTLLFLIIIPTPIKAQLAPQKLPANWEVYRENVPVSGHFTAGIVLNNQNGTIRPNTFFILVPDISKYNKKHVCVDIKSIEGKYTTLPNAIIYNVDNLSQGWNKFSLPTQYYERLKKYRSDQITILCRLVSDCKDPKPIYLVASWGNDFESNKKVILNFNTSNPAYIKYRNPRDNKISQQLCSTDRNPANIAYRSSCEIPFSWFNGKTKFIVSERLNVSTVPPKFVTHSYDIAF